MIRLLISLRIVRLIVVPGLMVCSLAGTVLADTQVMTSQSATSAASAGVAGTPAAKTASSSAQKPVDPLDKLCSQIGAPVSESDLQAFSRYEILPASGKDKGQIRWFRSDRARAVWDLSNGSKMANLVTIKGRQLCLNVPGGSEAVCGVPLTCMSKEADFVMVDTHDKPFVQIDKPRPRPAGAKPLPENHDWVAFAGGTADVHIPNTAVTTNGPVTGFYAGSNQGCAVGPGIPGLDSGYAYFWTSENSCVNGYAQGTGDVVYLSQQGDVGFTALGEGSGLVTKDGTLSWSFPKSPIRLWVECDGSTSDQIPAAANEVTSVKVRLILPGSVEDGEPMVYRKLARTANSYVRKICGVVPGGSAVIHYDILPNFTSVQPSLDMYASGSGLEVNSPISEDIQSFQGELDTNVDEWRGVFGRAVSMRLRSDWRTQVTNGMHQSSSLSDVADGIEINRQEALVALTGGLTIQMPWSNQSSTYGNGQFQVDWYESSHDPVAEFLQQRSGDSGWQQLSNFMTNENTSRAHLTCEISKRAAQRLPLSNMVSVRATLVTANQNDLVLECASP